MEKYISHRVHNSLNKSLTIWGAERRLFFMAVVLGGATFNVLGSVFGGALMFGALYAFARWSTATDPELLRILMNSARVRSVYDPLKFEHGDRLIP